MSLNVALLRQSFELIVTREPDLSRRFYDELFARHPQTRPLFTRNTRDRQERMLTEALVAVMDRLDDAPWLSDNLRALGARHREYGVSDEMYAMVEGALVATLARVAAESWTSAHDRAWREALSAITSLMKAGARDAG